MKKAEEIWARLGIGRSDPVRCCYILVKPKPTLTDVPAKYTDIMQSSILNPEWSLIEQIKNLRDKPDLIIMKCHSIVLDKSGKGAQNCMRNMVELENFQDLGYNMTRLIPFQVQRDLADRFSMISLLEDVCTSAAHLQLGKHAVPGAINVEGDAILGSKNQVRTPSINLRIALVILALPSPQSIPRRHSQPYQIKAVQ